MMPRPLLLASLFSVLCLCLVAACTKEIPPVRLFFIGSTRFTSGNKTSLGAGDTLATRIYGLTDDSSPGLKRVHATVTYTPNRQPFAYPDPITAFVFRDVPTGEQITYLDSVFAPPYPKNFLLTSVFGVRTTAGAETWQYEITDAANVTSARSFVATVRRADSASVLYNSYTLRLQVPATGVSARRFIQLKSGLALPTYTVLGTTANVPSTGANPLLDQQALTDLVQSVDGLRLYSPDVVGSVASLPENRWPKDNRRKTLFHLTSINTLADFSGQADTFSIRRLYTAPVTSFITSLTLNQVYAFRTFPIAATATQSAAQSSFGIIRVASVPGGTTAGLQLEVRVAKQRQTVAFLYQ